MECPTCGADLSNRPERCPGCGKLLRYKTVPERSDVEPAASGPLLVVSVAGFRVNVLCLVGAVLAVAAVFSTWFRMGFIVWTAEMNLIEVYNLAEGGASNFWLPAVLFLIGTVIAFVSPLGGIMQVAGAPLFISAFASSTDGRYPSGLGPYLGIAAGVIVLVSLAYPIGIGYRTRPTSVLSRVLTVSPLRGCDPRPH